VLGERNSWPQLSHCFLAFAFNSPQEVHAFEYLLGVTVVGGRRGAGTDIPGVDSPALGVDSLAILSLGFKLLESVEFCDMTAVYTCR
jgi:hypothetical protein